MSVSTVLAAQAQQSEATAASDPTYNTSISRAYCSSDRRPIFFFGTLLLLSAAAYVPLAIVFNPFRWSTWGLFTFQTSRVLHCLVYLLFGIGIGAYGLERGLLAHDGNLARRWFLWCGASLVTFAVAAGVGIAAMYAHPGSCTWEIAADSTFVLSCATSSFAFLALLVRFAGKRNRVCDSLNENAYGVYLVHYAFVSWIQLTLLKLRMSAIAKSSLVFASAALLSWGTAALLRRIPLAREVPGKLPAS